MTEKNKMLIGAIVIILIMVLSYKLFPRNVEREGSLLEDEIKSLQDALEEVGEDEQAVPEVTGPGGCTTLEECTEYCSLPENEEECSEIMIPDVY